MGGLSRLILLFVFLSLPLFGEKVDTFYGTVDVTEPVLVDLIHSAPFQRLKAVHQYGVAFYTTHRENYTRYDHSLGVFAILRIKGASLKEQISGLLHDLSHTAFSHVGDWVFGKEFQEGDYQSTIHKLYLKTTGIEDLLAKYGYTLDDILPLEKNFPMLEQPLPSLSADRIEYNIQGAYYQNFLTKEETRELLQDLVYSEGRWIISRKDLATKLMRFSLFMTEDCWGSPVNYATSRWLADAILRGLKTGLISWNDLHFGVDQDIWDKLSSSQDPLIKNRMTMLAHPDEYYRIVPRDEATIFVKFRCRGIDPWIKHEGKTVRLTSIDPQLAAALQTTQEKAAEGWPLQIQSAGGVGVAQAPPPLATAESVK